MARTARHIDWDELDTVQVASNINRPLGSLEYLFWLRDQNRSFHFAVTAQISGRASPYDWREALDLIQERHPLLSVCIDGSPGSVPRFRQRDGAPIPLRIVEEDPKTHWEREVNKELDTPFDPSRAPLIRAVLIQGIRSTGFILVAHHSIADGLSLAYLIRDALSVVSGGPFTTLRSLPCQEEILAATGPISVASAGDPQDNPPTGNSATYRPLNERRPSVQGLRLPPALTQRLRDHARREETTVHGALSAALAIAGRKVFASWRKRPVRVINPSISGRFYASGKIAAFSSAPLLACLRDACQPFGNSRVRPSSPSPPDRNETPSRRSSPPLKASSAMEWKLLLPQSSQRMPSPMRQC